MKRRSSHKHAFSLVEVTLALGVASFTLLAIFGLLPVGLMSTRGAVDQTAANGIMSSLMADMRASRPEATASERFGVTMPVDPTAGGSSTLYFNADGKVATSLVEQSRYRALVKFVPAAQAGAPHQAMIQISWPAQQADLANVEGSVRMFSAFDRHHR